MSPERSSTLIFRTSLDKSRRANRSPWPSDHALKLGRPAALIHWPTPRPWWNSRPFKWECVEWSKSARDEFGDWDFDEVRRTAALRCESCNHHFDDGDRMRRELNATGKFVSKNPKASKENVEFHSLLPG
jgi:hypothetical protein